MAASKTKSNLAGALSTAAAVALASCVVSQTTTQPGPALGNQYREGALQAAPGVPPVGDYLCRFKMGDYEYPPYPCQVSDRGDGTLYLEKLAGSQRVRGVITSIDNRRFRFEGTFFCPWGDCTEEISTEFDTVDNGLYKAMLTLSAEPTLLTLDYLPDGFGGATYARMSGGYGGYGYGGTGYGGTGYGGTGYGGAGYGSGSGPTW